ncbi:P22 phage major capsid protein family protein [Acidovorax sp. M14]|uniref:P22 phage major capsid protein family protein n=1 Tax=Acidovorax sp. M14 TaxID=3411354 RepID=UPI003BF47EE9
MANILTGLIPDLYAALDVVAREQQGFIPSVQRDATASAGAIGQEVVSPVVPANTAEDITPGVHAQPTGSIEVGTVKVALTKARAVPLIWTGEEQLSVSGSINTIMRDQFAQAFRTLSNEVERDLALTALLGASRAVGTAGTAPFGVAGDLSDAAYVNQILDDNGAPTGDRALVMSSSAMANMRGKQSVLFKVDEAGTEDLLRNGVIGRLQGLNLHTSRFAASNTKGTGASYVANGAFAAGATGVTLKTGTGTVLAGNVVTFDGDSNKYVVGTGVTAPGTLALNAPGLQSAVANNAVMTLGNSYTANVAFHKNAIVLATRVPSMPIGGDSADDVTLVTDPVSGLTFQVCVYKMYKQTKIEIGLVWGMKVIKPEFIATLLG